MYIKCAVYDISIQKRHNYLRIIYRPSVRHNNAIDIRVMYTYINVFTECQYDSDVISA